MFTGLISDTGKVVAVSAAEDGVTLRLSAPVLTKDLSRGDSVALSGVCLSVTDVASGWFEVQVTNETLRHSNLGRLQGDDLVNLELPLAAGERLGGHFVQGHVDGLGAVENVTGDGFARRAEIALDPELMRYLVDRGSIAVDGVSLTVIAVDEGLFSVNLIPETIKVTTLSRLKPGAEVNVEVDLLGKHVEKLLDGRGKDESHKSIKQEEIS